MVDEELLVACLAKLDDVTTVQNIQKPNKPYLKSLDYFVIPAQAGIQVGLFEDSRLRGNDGALRTL